MNPIRTYQKSQICHSTTGHSCPEYADKNGAESIFRYTILQSLFDSAISFRTVHSSFILNNSPRKWEGSLKNGKEHLLRFNIFTTKEELNFDKAIYRSEDSFVKIFSSETLYCFTKSGGHIREIDKIELSG